MSLLSHASRALFTLLALVLALTLAVALLVAPAGAAAAGDVAAGDAAAAADPSAEPVSAEAAPASSLLAEPTTEPSSAGEPAAQPEPPAEEIASADPAPAPVAEQSADESPLAPQQVSDSNRSASVKAMAEPGVGVLRVGPEAIAPPYLHWEVRDVGGTLVPGGSFTLQQRNSTNTNWSDTSYPVADCTAATCNSRDRDFDGAEYQVRSLGGTQASDTSGTGLTNRRYRVQPATPPAGWAFQNANAWREMSSSIGNGTHSFGTFTVVRTTESVIVVKVGGDRDGTGVSPLGDVRLQLWNGDANGPTGSAARTESWASCTSSPVDGTCTFRVPIGAGGVAGTSRFWVVADTTVTPTGWLHNPQLRTGESGSGQSALSWYRFRTEAVTGGRLQTSGTDFMRTVNLSQSDGLQRTDSHGVWQLSRINPTVAQACGIDVALVLDFSGSIGDQDDAMVRAAAGMINALQGTDSNASLYSFSAQSPANGATNYPTMAPVNSSAQASSFINRFASGSAPNYQARWTPGGGTNWDEAFRAVAPFNGPANRADVVILLTDGNPTLSRNLDDVRSGGNGTYNEFQHVEAGVHSANLLKSQGSRIVALGVGAGVDSNSERNLAAVSGPTVNSDYFRAANFAEAQQQLRELAIGGCAGSVTVTKAVVPEGGTLNDATPAGGWVFDASATNGVAIAPTGTTSAGTGAINFPLTYPGGTSTTNVTLTERQQSGYVLVPQGQGQAARNASCWITDTDPRQTVAVTNAGALGFTVPVGQTQPVSCIVYNREPPSRATVEVDKLWVVNGGAPIADGDQPAWLRAVLGLTGTGQQTQQWNTVYPGVPAYAAGQTVQVSETVDPIPAWLPGCTVTSQVVTEANGAPRNTSIATSPYTHTLIAGANHVTVTNSVTCDTKLTLAKSVTNGGAEPTDWTLTAAGAGGPFTGATGDTAITSATVTAGVPYALTETDGSAVYVQDGGWVCVPLNANGAEATGSTWTNEADASVTVPLGMHAKCTVTNATAHLTLLKAIEGGGVLTPSMFDLTATPAALVGLAATTVAGADSPGVPNTFNVRPDHDYVLSEASDSVNLAYLGLRLEQLVNDEWVTVDDPAAAIRVAVGEHETYRFVNAAPQPLTLPLTGGIGADAYGLGGAAMLLLALLAAAVIFTRSRMRPVTTGGRHA